MKKKSQVRLNSTALLSTAIIMGNSLMGPIVTLANAEDPAVAQPTVTEVAPQQEMETTAIEETITIPEVTPEVTPEVETTPEVTPEVTPEIEVTPEVEAIPEVTPEVEVVQEVTPDATPAVVAEAQPTADTPNAVSDIDPPADKIGTGKVIVNSIDPNGKLLNSYTLDAKNADHWSLVNASVPRVILGYIVDVGNPSDQSNVVQLEDYSYVWRTELTDGVKVINYNYIVDEARATIKFMNDTTGQQLFSTTIKGEINTNPGFNTAAKIKEFTAKGYELVSNGVPQNPLSTNLVDNVYEVHLKHGTESKQTKKSVSRTVNMFDGTKVFDTIKQEHTFTRTDIYDKVTKTTTTGAWSDNNEWTFEEVKPKAIYGYSFNSGSAAAVKVNAGSQSSTSQLNYSPNEETAKVIVKDQTSGKVLDTQNVTGYFGTTSKFDVNGLTAKYVGLGYDVVKSNLPKDGIKFDFDGFVPEYTLTVKEGIDVSFDNHEVSRTVNFKFENGGEAAKSVKQTVKFTKKTETNRVTGKSITGDWTLADGQLGNEFSSVQVKAITGYTADTKSIPSVSNVEHGDKSKTLTVTYAANDVSAKVQYIDGTTGEVVATDDYNGKFGEEIKFTHDTLNELEDKGYSVVDNPTAQSVTYDVDGTKSITVRLGHQVLEETETKDVSRTFQLINKETGEVITTVTQTVTFTNVTTTDKVTGEVRETGWKASAPGFDAINLPALEGMITPADANFDYQAVSIDDEDQTFTVEYEAKPETPNKPGNSGNETPDTDKDDNKAPGANNGSDKAPGSDKTPGSNNGSNNNSDKAAVNDKKHDTANDKSVKKQDQSADEKSKANDVQTGVAGSSYGVISAIMAGTSVLLAAVGFKLRKRD